MATRDEPADIETIRVRITAVAAGGEGIARDARGRVVFVSGALPGEDVVVALSEVRKDFSRGSVVSVVSASPDRVVPFCERYISGCGGCDWQYVAPDRQLAYKSGIVADALRRIGRISAPQEFEWAPVELVDRGFRSTVRAAVDEEGKLGYRRRSSHEVCRTGPCPLAVGPLASLMVLEAPGSDEVILRADDHRRVTVQVRGRRDRAVRESLRLPPPSVSIDVVVIDQGDPIGRADPIDQGDPIDRADPSASTLLRYTIDGADLQVSPGSFFQTRADGAEALVHSVGDALADGRLARHGSRRSVLVDLYGGVGLFAATLGRSYDRVITVESVSSATSDAKANLASHHDAHVVGADASRWRVDPALLRGYCVDVVADPPRTGLGREGVATVMGLRPERIVLVSCDAAAGARDVGGLLAAGCDLDGWWLVDLFPHTSHVEVVFVLSAPRIA